MDGEGGHDRDEEGAEPQEVPPASIARQRASRPDDGEDDEDGEASGDRSPGEQRTPTHDDQDRDGG